MTNRIRDYEPVDLDDDGGEWEPVSLTWRELLRIFAFACMTLAGIAAVEMAARIGWGG